MRGFGPGEMTVTEFEIKNLSVDPGARGEMIPQILCPSRRLLGKCPRVRFGGLL